MSGEEEFQAGSGCYEDQFTLVLHGFCQELIFVYMMNSVEFLTILHEISSHHGLF